MDQRVTEIRKVLDALAKVETADNDTKEQVHDKTSAKIRSMERDGIIEIVKQAMETDKRRRKYSPFVFAQLYDVPGIEAVFSELLKNADSTGRADIIQTIGLRKMCGLVGVLNEHFVHESDDFCRTCLLHTLGRLADESSLPIFEYLMRRRHPRDEWSLLTAGINFGAPAFRDYLISVFENPKTLKSHKVAAAWGLGKLRDRNAYEYLITMLSDPDVRTDNSFEPGESRRAAQALADINGWDFEWHRDFVDLVKQKVIERNEH